MDAGRHTFTFLWEIEKFSRWEHVNHSYVLESPQFCSRILHGSVFRLHLFPSGVHERDSQVTLAIMTLTRFCSNLPVNCEYSYLGADGKPLSTGYLEGKRLEAGKLLQLPDCPMQLEVFGVEKEDYIPQDVFTVRCRIWDNSMKEDEYVFGRTRLDIREESFTWSINRFSTLQLHEKVTHPAGISFFPCLRQPLTLTFFLACNPQGEPCVEFEVVLKKISRPLWFCCYVSFLGSHGEVIKVNRMARSFDPSQRQQTWSIKSRVKQKELLMRKEEFLRDDVLNLHFMVEFPQCSSTIEASSYGNVERNAMQDVRTISSEVSRGVEHLRISTSMKESIGVLLNDIKTMFKRRIKSDFQLRSGGSSHPVHKNVLSVRSPVFKAIFDSEVEGAVLDSLDVRDIDAETLEMMLSFMYTGKVNEVLDFQKAIKLYYAAEKYEVSTLKPVCSVVLQNDMSVENVCDVLALAERHLDAELMSYVTDFIEKNYDEVLRSEEWKALRGKDSFLAEKIVKKVGKKNVKKARQ